MVSKLTDTNSQTGKNNESSQRLAWKGYRGSMIDIVNSQFLSEKSYKIKDNRPV